jgi:hypothetical protein
MMTTCVVLLCDAAYFNKFLYTCEQLITRGNYKGPICLVIGDDLLGSPQLSHPLITQNNIIIKHFPNIPFTDTFLGIARNLNRAPHWPQKLFQFHKFHLFNMYFKQWDYIFYIDCGITIFSDITPIMNTKEEFKFLAHSDAYPTYQRKLHNQFDKTHHTYSSLVSSYNLECDYPQTTIILYDTRIIEDSTYDELLELMNRYPCSITNDQGIYALYFTQIKSYFKQIPVGDGAQFYYDYLRRNPGDSYIMLKAT